MSLHRRHIVLTAVCAAALTIAGCSSPASPSAVAGNSEPTTSAVAPDGSALAKAPTSINSTVPLDKAPPKKVIAWLQCQLPACSPYTPGIKTAAAALGWTVKVFTMDPSNPGVAVQQAINANVDYIGFTSVSMASIAPQVAAAKAKGILFFDVFGTDQPDPASNAMFADIGDASTLETEGAQLGAWIVKDSASKANVLMVNTPAVPIMVAMQAKLKSTIQNCSSCSASALDLALSDVGTGDIPGKVVDYIRAHPETNYVTFGFADLAAGVSSALKQAGLDTKVKLTGISFDSAALDGIVSGAQAAWTAQPSTYTSWVVVDAMARAAVGIPSADVQTLVATLPTFIVDTSADAEALLKLDGYWPGPIGYQDAYRRLWGL